MKTKIIILVSILTLIMLSGCNYLKEESYDLDSCIKEKISKFGDEEGYVRGRIDIFFNGGVTEEEARQVIESRGLVLENIRFAKSKDSFYSHIKVPDYFELEWMCKFENDEPSINYTTPDYKVRGVNIV